MKKNLKIHVKIVVLIVLICMFAVAGVFAVSYIAIKSLADNIYQTILITDADAAAGAKEALREQSLHFLAYAFAVILIVTGLLAIMLGRLVSRPIRRLAAQAGKITEGDSQYRIPVESWDEIGALAGAFNKMADKIHGYTQHIIELAHTKSELESMAYTDTLTGLFNRRYFMELALIQMNRTFRQNGNAFVIMMDVDHFKQVNDTYGHQVGDEVLKQIAWRMRDTIRSYDLLARYGGEEFVLLVTDVSEEDAYDLVERVRLNIVNEPIVVEEIPIAVSASFGMTRVDSVDTFDSAIALADKAMYHVKNTGRNRTVFYGRDQDLL